MESIIYTSNGRVNPDLCTHCDLQATPEGHDGCLGAINSDIWNACCGHGNRGNAYIQFNNSTCIRGEAAISIMKLIKPSIITENH